jgi:hypothetical protein
MPGYELKQTIHSNQFMIIGMNKESREFVVKPGVYTTYARALHMAQQYAMTYHQVKYIVVAVAAIAEAVDNPTIITKYMLEL